jgi:hypothetical protein
MVEPQHITGYFERLVTDLMALSVVLSDAESADESIILVSEVRFRPWHYKKTGTCDTGRKFLFSFDAAENPAGILITFIHHLQSILLAVSRQLLFQR